MWEFALVLVAAQLCAGFPVQENHQVQRQEHQEEVDILKGTKVECSVTATVTYPVTSGGDDMPTIKCESRCTFTAQQKDQSYFIGYVYRHFERLEREYGLMVEVRYNKGRHEGCKLVPSVTNDEVFAARENNNALHHAHLQTLPTKSSSKLVTTKITTANDPGLMIMQRDILPNGLSRAVSTDVVGPTELPLENKSVSTLSAKLTKENAEESVMPIEVPLENDAESVFGELLSENDKELTVTTKHPMEKNSEQAKLTPFEPSTEVHTEQQQVDQNHHKEVDVLKGTKVECGVKATVTYPAKTGGDVLPTLNCESKCTFTAQMKNQSYFIGYVYRHFERLEQEYGLMVEVRYNKGKHEGCKLVPSVPNEQVFTAHEGNSSLLDLTNLPLETYTTKSPSENVPAEPGTADDPMPILLFTDIFNTAEVEEFEVKQDPEPTTMSPIEQSTAVPTEHPLENDSESTVSAELLVENYVNTTESVELPIENESVSANPSKITEGNYDESNMPTEFPFENHTESAVTTELSMKNDLESEESVEVSIENNVESAVSIGLPFEHESVSAKPTKLSGENYEAAHMPTELPLDNDNESAVSTEHSLENDMESVVSAELPLENHEESAGPTGLPLGSGYESSMPTEHPLENVDESLVSIDHPLENDIDSAVSTDLSFENDKVSMVPIKVPLENIESSAVSTKLPLEIDADSKVSTEISLENDKESEVTSELPLGNDVESVVSTKLPLENNVDSAVSTELPLENVVDTAVSTGLLMENDAESVVHIKLPKNNATESAVPTELPIDNDTESAVSTGLPLVKDTESVVPTEIPIENDVESVVPTEHPLGNDAESAVPTEHPLGNDVESAISTELPMENNEESAAPTELSIEDDTESAVPTEIPLVNGDESAVPTELSKDTDFDSTTLSPIKQTTTVFKEVPLENVMDSKTPQKEATTKFISHSTGILHTEPTPTLSEDPKLITTSSTIMTVTEPDWALIGTAYFHISKVSGTWKQGQRYCESIGAKLASIRSQEEQDGLSNLLVSNAWIGLHDMLKEGDHSWEDQTQITYTNWEEGQPDNAWFWFFQLWDEEDCVEMRDYYNFQWNDEECYKHNLFVCRKNEEIQGRPTPAKNIYQTDLAYVFQNSF